MLLVALGVARTEYGGFKGDRIASSLWQGANLLKEEGGSMNNMHGLRMCSL